MYKSTSIMIHNIPISHTKLTPCAYFRNGMLFYALAAKKLVL